MSETYNEICKSLAEPMPFKWRLQSANQYGGNLVAYVDARQVQQRFDDVMGMNWSVEYIDRGTSLFARIGVRLPDGTWVFREDLGTESNTEKEKGEVSDSFKRAAVAFGVGRFLYSLGVIRTDAAKGRNGKDAPFIDKSDPKTSLEYADDLNAYANYYIANNGDKAKAKADFLRYKQAGGGFNAENKAKAQQAAVTTLGKQQAATNASKPQQSNQPQSNASDLIKQIEAMKVKLLGYDKDKQESIDKVVNGYAKTGLDKASAATLSTILDWLTKDYLLHCVQDAYNEDIDKTNAAMRDPILARFKALFGDEVFSTELSSSNPALKASEADLRALLTQIQQAAV